MNIENVQREIRKAIGYAQERGWRVIRNHCVVRTAKSCKVCPMAALVLMGMPANRQDKYEGNIEDVKKRAGKILGVKPVVVDCFMGAFDNSKEGVEWPRGTTDETKALAQDFGDLGEKLRNELKPKLK
jgi:hypothetical protein